MVVGLMIGAVFNLLGEGHYIHWGFVQISVANLVVIVLMVVTFVAAIALPFRHRAGGRR
jgi:hypothetical protein